MDGSELARSRTVTLALGFGDFARELQGTPSPSDVSADHPLRRPVATPARDGRLNAVRVPTATPLPTLTEGRSRPAVLVLVSVTQDDSALVRARIRLGSSVPVGTTVQFRYWPHSGFLPDSEGKWQRCNATNWDASTPGARRVFYYTDTAKWHKFNSGVPIRTALHF